MGVYLNNDDEPVHHGKAEWLINDHDAERLELVPTIEDLDKAAEEGHVVVCVVRNPLFDAAGVIYDYEELELAVGEINDGDKRPRTWLRMPRDNAIALNPDVARRT